MNERIKELALQAVTRFDMDMYGSIEPDELGQWIRFEDLEKFAELVEKDVIERLKNKKNSCYTDIISDGGMDPRS